MAGRMSAPAARAERLSLPIRRRVRARIAHQLAIRTGSPKLIARRSAAATRGREADISIPRVLSSQPQKACNHQYHDDNANDVKHFLITHYPQLSRHGTKQEHVAVSAGLNDGAQQGAISKGAQRGPVCCSLWNRGSVPGGGDALALAIRLCLPGLRRAASQLGQDPGALPVYRLSTADIRDRRNDFRGDQGAAVHLV